MTEGAQAWVTLATNDSYALGALVLARSLRRVNTTRQLAVMVTPGVSGPMRGVLADVFDVVSEVNILDSEDAANLALLSRPELGITFTKIHCWKLTQFSKCVFLDADTLVIQNSDELFDREELSAAPDAGWPDCFNSGVYVFKPSMDTYSRILNFALSHGSFDGGDQGLLNMYFNDWSQADSSRRLPFTYNMCASATYSYLPAYRVFGQSVKIVHFIGQEKPWLIFFDTATGTVRPPSGQEHLQELLQGWWNIFRSDVHPRLSPEMGGGDSQSATMVEQVQASFSQIFTSSAEPSASSQFSFHQSPPSFPPHSHAPPHSYQHEPYSRPHQPPPPSQPENHEFIPHNEPPPPPPVHEFLVAIQRFPPDHFWTPPPPPPPPIVYQPPPPPPHHSSPESSDSESNHLNSSPHHHHPHNDSQAQSSSSGGSGSPQVNISSNHANDGCHNQGQNQQPNQSSQQASGENVRKKRHSKSKGIAGVYAKIAMEGEKSGEQLEYVDSMRKLAWEQGHIDYMGKDSFDNIMKRIQASMAQTSVQKTKAKSPTPQRRQSPPKEEQPKPAAAQVSEQEPAAAPSVPEPQVQATQASQTAAVPVSEPQIEAKQATPTTAAPVSEPQVEATQAPPTTAAPVSEPQVQATQAPSTTAAPVSEPQAEVSPAPQTAAAAPVAEPQIEVAPAPQTTAAPVSEPQIEAVEIPQPTTASVPEPQVTAAQAPQTTTVAPVPEPQIETVVIPQTTAAPAPEPKPEVPPAPQTTAAPVSEPQAEAQSVPETTTPVTPAPDTAAIERAQEEDRKAQEERQAVEKKLAEQKKAAEQKLEEEKKAAAARAAAVPTPSAAPQEPKAPPRKDAGLGNAMQYGVGLGLLGAAVVLVFAIYTAYSPASLFL